MQLQGITLGGNIGMYLNSPVSLQAGIEIGGGNQGLLGVFKAQIGYDISDHLKLYFQYVGAQTGSLFFYQGVFFGFSEGSETSVNLEQAGIRYTF